MKPHPDRATAHKSGADPLSAEWATPALLASDDYTWKPNRLILGQRLGIDGKPILVGFGGGQRGQDDRHIVTIAGARSGKGLTCIRPNLATYGGSVLVIDPKGEHARYELETQHRRAMGHKIVILDPFQTIGGADKFNPFHGLKRNLADPSDAAFFGRLTDIAEALIIPEGSDNTYFTKGAKLLLTFFIQWMVATPAGASVARLRDCLSGFDSDPDSKELLPLISDGDAPTIFTKALEVAGALDDQELARLASQFAGSGYRAIESFSATLQNQMGFLRDVAAVSSASSFDLAELKEGKLSLYLVLPPSKIPSHFRWLRLLLVLAMSAMEKGDPPALDVLFLLEEFAALGHLEIIEKAAGLMPGFGVKLWVILQDLTQLQGIYKASWETFLENASAVQAFGLDGATTTEYLSKRIGEKLYEVQEAASLTSAAVLAGGRLAHERREWQRLVPAHAVGQMFPRLLKDPDGRETLPLLLLRKGFPPASIHRLPYEWKHK